MIGRMRGWLGGLAEQLDWDAIWPWLVVALTVSAVILFLAAVLGTASWLFWLGQHGWRF